VKLWPGKSEQQKERLAQRIAQDVMDVFNYGEESVSVGFEEISSKDWKEKVYKPDIKDSGTRSTRSQDTRCKVSKESFPFFRSKKKFVHFLYRERDFGAFDVFNDFVESISCETSKSCQVRGSSPPPGSQPFNFSSL